MRAADEANERRGSRAGNGRGSRGSTRNSARLASLQRKPQGAKADWGGCAPERLQGVVVAIGRMGGAATFGYSRDGGAYGLTLYLDGEREQLWFNGDADLDEELQLVIDHLTALD